MLRWLLVAGLLMVPAGCIESDDEGLKAAEHDALAAPEVGASTVRIVADCSRLPCGVPLDVQGMPFYIDSLDRHPTDGRILVGGSIPDLEGGVASLGDTSRMEATRTPVVAVSSDHGSVWFADRLPMRPLAQETLLHSPATWGEGETIHAATSFWEISNSFSLPNSGDPSLHRSYYHKLDGLGGNWSDAVVLEEDLDRYVRFMDLAGGKPTFGLMGRERLQVLTINEDQVERHPEEVVCERLSGAVAIGDELLVACGPRFANGASASLRRFNETEARFLQSEGDCGSSAVALRAENWKWVAADCADGEARLVQGDVTGANWNRTLERPETQLSVALWHIPAIDVDQHGLVHAMSVFREHDGEGAPGFDQRYEMWYSVHAANGTLLDQALMDHGYVAVSLASPQGLAIWPEYISVYENHVTMISTTISPGFPTILTTYRLEYE